MMDNPLRFNTAHNLASRTVHFLSNRSQPVITGNKYLSSQIEGEQKGLQVGQKTGPQRYITRCCGSHDGGEFHPLVPSTLQGPVASGSFKYAVTVPAPHEFLWLRGTLRDFIGFLQDTCGGSKTRGQMDARMFFTRQVEKLVNIFSADKTRWHFVFSHGLELFGAVFTRPLEYDPVRIVGRAFNLVHFHTKQVIANPSLTGSNQARTGIAGITGLQVGV